jgi:hypothetical protein
VWNVPTHPNPYFTGRDLLLAEIHTRLTALEAARRRVVLTGLGGVGKTQLAVEYCYRQRADYELVWWVRSEQRTSLLGDYGALAGQPPLAADPRLAEDMAREGIAGGVRQWLERHRRWLLVLDNVEDPAVVAELLPRNGTGHVVITSQAETGWEPLADSLLVQVLAPTDAVDFLATRTNQQSPEAMAGATTLAGFLGGLPLALEQAGAYIAATGTVTLAGYAQLFATRAPELLKRGQPLSYQHTVATTWSLALQQLQEDEPSAVALLTLAAFLAPEDLPLPLLITHHDELPELLATTATDPLALADAVAALRRYSLVRVVADGLFVHRLLQTVVRSALGVEAERAWAASAIRLLHASFPRNSDEKSTWPECERLLFHVIAVTDHGKRLEVEPEAWLWLLSQTARYLRSRGQHRLALTLDEQALAGRRRTLGEDHPDTLTSMNNLAETRRALGDLDGARQRNQQILAGLHRMLGEDHPYVLASMSNLAATMRDLGDLDGARQLHEQILAGYRQALGDDHPDTLRSMNNLAETRRALGDLEGARQLHEQALAGYRRVLGEDHPDTLRSMNNLTAIRRELGEL